jgi:phage shock protein C
MTKKLYRSETNKIISGVLGGVGEYLDVDPTIVRLIYALLTILTGAIPGLLFYFLALFIIPTKQHFNIHTVSDEEVEKNKKEHHDFVHKSQESKDNDSSTKNKIA